jgi:hypothetical protein
MVFFSFFFWEEWINEILNDRGLAVHRQSPGTGLVGRP